MLTNLARHGTTLRYWDYTMLDRLGVMPQKAEKMFSEIQNEWLCNVQHFFQESESSKYRENYFGCPYPYPVPVWKQFLNVRIRLQTHYPAVYPTGTPDSDHLCLLLPKLKKNHGPVFHKFLTLGTDPRLKEKRWILPESTLALRSMATFAPILKMQVCPVSQKQNLWSGAEHDHPVFTVLWPTRRTYSTDALLQQLCFRTLSALSSVFHKLIDQCWLQY